MKNKNNLDVVEIQLDLPFDSELVAANEIRISSKLTAAHSPPPISLRVLSNLTLTAHLKSLVKKERRLTAQIIELIHEVDRRGLYLEKSYSSLFAFVTDELGYSGASAQRRIDCARMLSDVPELKDYLATGCLHLMQVAVVAQGVRQKKKENPQAAATAQDKRAVIEKIKGFDLKTSQQLVAAHFQLKPKSKQQSRKQADGTLRLGLTFSKEQTECFERVKEVISHSHPNPSWAELFHYLGMELLKRKDPLAEKKPRSKKTPVTKAKKAKNFEQSILNESECNGEIETEVATLHDASGTTKMKQQQQNFLKAAMPAPSRPHYPAQTKRAVFQRDRCCQHRDPSTGRICSSRFQLQLDHRQSVWAGGGNDINNLQLLCSAHNKEKYRREAGISRR